MANSTAYVYLTDLCRQIQIFNNYNQTRQNDQDEHDDPELPLTSSLINGILLEGLNYTKTLNFTMEMLLKEFEHFTEWYLIVVIAAFGIVSNIVIMIMLGRDKAMRPLAYLLHMLMLIAEVLYLTSVIIFIQLRHFLKSEHHQMDWMTLITIIMSVSQCTSIWLLYIVATDSYRAIRLYQKPSKLRQIAQARSNIVFIIIGSIIFHIPFIPQIRVFLYKMDPDGFDPCIIPVEEHWDFKSPSTDYDMYYILYYSLLYSFVLFWIPFLMIAARDKDIIDLLHLVMDYSIFKRPEVINACYTAKVVAIFCNVGMFCMSPKLVLLLFQMTNYAVNFIGEAQIFFEFFNVMANLLLVFKSSIYLLIFLIFQPRVKVIICEVCCHCCCRCQRSYTHSQSDQHIPMVLITETEHCEN